MKYVMPTTCPACHTTMAVTELTCPQCETKVQGYFHAPGLHRLTAEQLEFVEVFVRCRGNIKEVERDLKISYPTVRSRLDNVIQAMGYAVTAAATEDPEPQASVLEAFEQGDLSFEEALQKLRGETWNREP